MNNTGVGLIISTTLVLGSIYGFRWYYIFMFGLCFGFWLVSTDSDLFKKNKKLTNERLELEIELLEKKLKK